MRLGDIPRGTGVSRRGARRLWTGWLLGWLGLVVVAIINGGIRDGLYRNRVGALRAHHISTACLLGVMGVYVGILDHRFPTPTARSALAVGASWLGLTVLFEFGFGHYVARTSWQTLLEQYDVRRGYIWVLVPFSAALTPGLARALRVRRT